MPPVSRSAALDHDETGQTLATQPHENTGESVVSSTASVLCKGAAEKQRAAANGWSAPTTDELGLQLNKKAGSQVVRLAHTHSDVSLMEVLKLSETANTRAEFEAKITQHKEYFKLVEVMYNNYSSCKSDQRSPWPEALTNLVKDQFLDLSTLNPGEVDQDRHSDYLKRVWDVASGLFSRPMSNLVRMMTAQPKILGTFVS